MYSVGLKLFFEKKSLPSFLHPSNGEKLTAQLQTLHMTQFRYAAFTRKNVFDVRIFNTFAAAVRS